ncbi:MAG: response regulator transcription factor, partial [Flavobacteriales bacterium]|nr:response regulator transcription factor [Flavobacteriales bacterium]
SSSIEEYLKQDAYLCEVAATYDEAMEKAGIYEYDCILVDITLPGGSGLDVIRALKKAHSKAGIIVISAKNSLDDKIEGLEIGSDDYLTKPFHLSELNARIKALLRRKQFEGEPRIDFQEISVQTNKQQAQVLGEDLTLTRTEYRLLLYFLVNLKRVLSKESIAEHLAGSDADLL